MGIKEKLFYNKYFNELYPIEEKAYTIGLWKTSNDTTSEAVQDLIKVLKSEIASTELDIEANGRAGEHCLRNKKFKTKYRDEDNKKHTIVDKKQVIKLGYDKLKQKFENEGITLGEYKQSVETLLDKVNKGTIDKADYDLINYILLRNRYSVHLGLAVFAVFIVFIAFLIIYSISNGIVTP